VDLRSGLERCGNCSHKSGFDPRTFQPVASRYTGYLISQIYGRMSNARSFTAMQVQAWYLFDLEYSFPDVMMKWCMVKGTEKSLNMPFKHYTVIRM
jgi:hypothetical protein